MTTITLSNLKRFSTIDDPQASKLERAIMHALDSMPKGNPDKQITDADIAAFKAAFPSMGASLDRTELGTVLDVMENAGTGTAYEAGNMTLVAAARAELYGYSWSSPTGTEVSAAASTDISGHYRTTYTPVSLPSFTVGTLPDGSTEGVWQIAERVKAQLGAQYPDVLAMRTDEVAYKLLQANGLAMNADGSYPALRFGQVLQVAPYANGAMARVGALLEEVVKDLPEAAKHMVLATLAIGVGIFLASLWMTPGPATVAVLGYLATALGEAFMVGAGVGLVTLIAGAAMGSGGLSSAYEIKSNPEVGKLGANMVTALAAPKAIEYAGKGVTAASPYVKDALGKLSGILKPVAPVMETKAQEIAVQKPPQISVDALLYEEGRKFKLGFDDLYPDGFVMNNIANAKGQPIVFKLSEGFIDRSRYFSDIGSRGPKAAAQEFAEYLASKNFDFNKFNIFDPFYGAGNAPAGSPARKAYDLFGSSLEDFETAMRTGQPIFVEGVSYAGPDFILKGTLNIEGGVIEFEIQNFFF
jgi:hypothetical protein